MGRDLQYVTDQNGQRVAVLLPLEDYCTLTSRSPSDPEMLLGLSDAELQALADSKLAPSEQARLNELLARNADHQLSAEEEAELDSLLARVDQLTVLKTRARYTMHHQ